jgi:hypothetical protein
MAGDDDRFVSHRSNVYFGGLDHPVDVSAGRIVDERTDAVPAGSPQWTMSASGIVTDMKRTGRLPGTPAGRGATAPWR